MHIYMKAVVRMYINVILCLCVYSKSRAPLSVFISEMFMHIYMNAVVRMYINVILCVYSKSKIIGLFCRIASL